MIAQSQFPFITPQDYLDWEEKQPLKYEYIDGEVYAMTGGTIHLSSINFSLPISLIYEDIELEIEP